MREPHGGGKVELHKVFNRRLAPILFILALFLQNTSEAKVVEEHIFLIPIGKVDGKVLQYLKDKLPGCFPMTMNVAIDPQEEMPQSAYDQSRKQYRAAAVADEISQRITIDLRDERLLVVTDADLYAPELNFVFGLADAKKGIAVISLARLRNEFYGLKADEGLFLERALKEAVHELGHSWGLTHCPDARCVMFFSNSLADTDKKRNTFCHACRTRLRHRYDKPLIRGLSF
jgi:archaemetzincin